MGQITYIPKSEFDRVLDSSIDLKDKVAIFANMCRINTLYMIARAGSGHIGSSFSSLDLVSWIFLAEMGYSLKNSKASDDLYFSSKGHDVPGLYSVLLGLGLLPFEKIHTLRRLGGLPGHPDVDTPYMIVNTGPLGMGISKAKGFSFANRQKNKKGNIFVLTGDGELQEGQFWESLPSAVNQKHFDITAVIDHNKIQSDTWVSAVSDLGDLEKKIAAFGWYVARSNGHNISEFSSCFEQFRKVSDKPKILIADTVKGQGVSFMQQIPANELLYKFHSGAPSEEHYMKGFQELEKKVNDALAKVGLINLQTESVERPERPNMTGFQKMVDAYAKALVVEGEKNKNVVVLDGDLMLDCGLIPFREKFPERFRECGIAEQDMVSQAGAMALSGFVPIVHSFACFLSTRPNEQIYNNATEKSKVIYVGSLAGLIPSGPGHSHQSVRDITALGSVPGLILMEPCHEKEVGFLLDYAINKNKQSSYIRLVTVPSDIPYQYPHTSAPSLGEGVTLKEGKDVLVIGYGPVVLPQAYLAAQILEKKGISVKVVNLPWLNRIDQLWLAELVKDFRLLITLDNHYVSGGQGQFITGQLPLLDLRKMPAVKNIGVEEIPVCGQNLEALHYHKLDAASIAKSIEENFALSIL